MLISGAVLFSLFQLPPLLDGALARWMPHATYAAAIVLIVLFGYLKAAAYVLVAAFVVHLATRAYWVGLLGLNSVFAGGIRWERTQLGPVAQEVYRERTPPLPRLIARLDNFASVIFSFAVLVVLFIVISVLLVAVVGTVAYAVSSVAFGGRHLLAITAAAAALLTVPPVVAALVDKRFGARLDPGGRPRRLLRGALGVSYRTQLAGMLAPVLFTISSNGRRRTTYLLFYGVLLGSVYLVLAELLARRGGLAVNGADFFSERSEGNAVDYAHYESHWTNDAVNDAAPSIQADLVRDPYVRLFIPYQPPRHNPAVAARCPGVRPLETPATRLSLRNRRPPLSDAAARAALGCLAAIHAVTLNGAPLPALRFRFATHPRTGVSGIVAYIPTAALPRGENVLTVMPPPRRPGSTIRRALEPDIIPFWL
jgi:hypothetical protein